MMLDNTAGSDPFVLVCDVFGRPVEPPGSVDLVLDPVVFIEHHGGRLTHEKIRDWLTGQGPLNCIEICIPKFTDGRGFSVAARLREAGYTGELYACGDITQDVVYLLRRVGFSHVRLALKPGETLDPAVLQPFGAYYQITQDEQFPAL